MKQIIAALAAATALAACNGGSASPPPFSTGVAQPTPSPSPAPTPPVVVTRSVSFAWSGAAHSASSVGRAPRAVSSSEPVVVAAASGLAANDPTIAFGQSQAVLTAHEVDGSGNVVDPSPKTAAASDASVASVSTPAPGQSAPPLIVNGVGGGSTTIATTFADGVSGSIVTVTYLPLHLACPSNAENVPEPTGVALVNGKFVGVSLRALADAYLTGSSCPGDFADPGENTIHFPHGYQGLDAHQSVTSYTAATPFSQTGTSIPYSAYLAPRAVLTIGLLNVATTSGTYAKLRFTGLDSGVIADYNAMYVASMAGVYPY